MPKPSSPKSPEPPQTVTPCAVDFNLIDRARTLFEAAFPAAEVPATWSHGNRTFSIQDYLGFMLLGLYVPTCDSLRGLCRDSEHEEFKQRYRCFAMDLASVSRAPAHLPEKMLLPINRLCCHPRGRRGLRQIIFRTDYDKSRIRHRRIRMSEFTGRWGMWRGLRSSVAAAGTQEARPFRRAHFGRHRLRATEPGGNLQQPCRKRHLPHQARSQKCAILYIIVQNCRRLRINPKEYLTDVLTRRPGMLPKDAIALTPANWLKARNGKPETVVA